MLLLAVVAIILIVGALVIAIVGGQEGANSPVLLGVLGVIGVLAGAARWYFRRKHP